MTTLLMFMWLLSPKKMQVTATAYSTSPSENGGYSITRTGKRLRHGIVAVDPSVIPLHSRLFIPGYGYALAEDTGGRIKGRLIDLCTEDRHWEGRWGRRRVEVIVWPPQKPVKIQGRHKR